MDWRTFATDATAVAAVLATLTPFLAELRKWFYRGHDNNHKS